MWTCLAALAAASARAPGGGSGRTFVTLKVASAIISLLTLNGFVRVTYTTRGDRHLLRMDNDQCCRLIQLYKSSKMLWDSEDVSYTNRGLREDAWRNISEQMSLPVEDLKRKMTTLLGTYRREKSREKHIRITSSGRNKVYRSKWYAYAYFQFMPKKNNPGDTQNPIEDDDMHCDEPETDREPKQEPPSEEDEEEEIQTQQLLHENCKERKSKLNNEVDEEDERLNEPLIVSKQCVESPADAYHTFGQHIANELRKYDSITLAHVKHAISNIIFEADTGRFPEHNPGNFSRSARKRFYTSLPMKSSSKNKSTRRS